MKSFPFAGIAGMLALFAALVALNWARLAVRRWRRMAPLLEKLSDYYNVSQEPVSATEVLEALRQSPRYGKLFRKVNEVEIADWLNRLSRAGKANTITGGKGGLLWRPTQRLSGI